MLNETTQSIQKVVDLVFGLPTVYGFLGIGLFFTLYFKVPQIRFFWHAVRIAAGRYAKLQDFDDEPSIVKSITISIANPIGLGSVAGVALALTLGGPGAIAWMMLAGLAGMAIKLASLAANLSVAMPHPDGKGFIRGAMVIIAQKFSPRFSIFATLYALLIVLGSLFAGNLFQTNQIYAVLKISSIPIPYFALIVGIMMSLLTAITLFKFSRFDRVMASIAPFMALLYLCGGLWIIFLHYREIPDALRLIFGNIFSYSAAGSAALGIGLQEIMTHGVRRALFANEAGIGSHSLSKRPKDISPIQQGIAGMLGSCIDTVFTCLLTALIILCSGVWNGNLTMAGIELPALAFFEQFGFWGYWGIALFVCLFAFSTMLTWYGNGKIALAYLLPNRYSQAKYCYKLLFTFIAIFGPLCSLMLIINLSDIVFALMLAINMLATFLLRGEIKASLKKYRKDLKAERV